MSTPERPDGGEHSTQDRILARLAELDRKLDLLIAAVGHVGAKHPDGHEAPAETSED